MQRSPAGYELAAHIRAHSSSAWATHGIHMGYGMLAASLQGGFSATTPWPLVGSLPRQRDFAEERPDAYRAFETMAVRSTEAGLEIGLPQKLCLDRHVPDFLACLRCWIRRNLGEPGASRRPWRLHKLDLSHNNLSDESIAEVAEALRYDDVRVQRLHFAGNCAHQKGPQALTEYLWACPEAVVELDLSKNNIAVESGSEGNDPVSALLRCLYNHPGYPRRVARHATARLPESFDIEPLTLRLGGNRVKEPCVLLDLVTSKGRKERVGLRTSPEVYQPNIEEFLSVFMPGFQEQDLGDTTQDAEKPCENLATPAETSATAAAAAGLATSCDAEQPKDSDSENSSEAEAEEAEAAVAAIAESSNPGAVPALEQRSRSSEEPEAAVPRAEPERPWSPLPEAQEQKTGNTPYSLARPLFLDGLEEAALRRDMAAKFASLGESSLPWHTLAKHAVQAMKTGKGQQHFKAELALKLSTESLQQLSTWLLDYVFNLRR